MFSPNQLYDYLRYYCYTNKKNVTVLNTTVCGSKNLLDFVELNTPYIDDNIITANSNSNAFREENGCMLMYDQEPFDINAYYETTQLSLHNNNDFRQELNSTDFVCSRGMAIYTPIAAVSDINSNDVQTLRNNKYEIFYFWSNAITSRYWFQHYELLKPIHKQQSSARLGTYIRDVSGTREYRSKLINFFKSHTNTFCPSLDNKNISSDASATIDWNDQSKFDIHIVPETVFDVGKIHLTEKIFKPIVMYQPFILFAGPKSLEYLQNYGFKTFSSCWDESYDTEPNADKRLHKIIALLEFILNLDQVAYNKLTHKIKKITEYNRQYFYSDTFKQKLMNEMHHNLDNALACQEEKFYTEPGGTLFYYHDMYFKETGNLPRSATFQISKTNALKYAYTKSNSVGDAIVRKYNHLL
jgi:hypothetical protein